jgi:DNA repair protein RecO (recombination protein O)
MQQQNSEAIILHHLDYKDADRIITCFSLEQGLLKGFARNARKSRKRFGTALEPFSQVRLHWTDKAGSDMVSLQEAELIDLRSGLRKDIGALALASYGCELVEGLLGEKQVQPDVFHLLQAFLDHLNKNGLSLEARLLFELRLLALVGYAPHFLHCAACNIALEGEQAAFSAKAGGCLCLDCAPPSVPLKVSVMTFGTLGRSLQSPLTLFEGFRFSERTLAEGGKVLADALRQHLSRPPKSLSFMEQMLVGKARVAAIR